MLLLGLIWCLLGVWSHCTCARIEVNHSLCQFKASRGNVSDDIIDTPPTNIPIFSSMSAASKKLGGSFMHSPWSFLSCPRVLSSRKLRCVEASLEKMLDASHRRYSATLLQRLAGRHLLWGPPGPAPLDALLSQLSALQQENLRYCE